MVLRLGEMLVQSNVITSDQLEEALKTQVMFGGKLGTNLVELNFVDEQTIANTLSKKLGVPSVSRDDLMAIPESTISILSKTVVEKYKVVPISVDKSGLTIVTADPSNLNSFDELRFITSKAIKTVIAPEIDLILAMERYYDIPRDVRYIHMMERGEKGQNGGKGAEPSKTKEKSSIPEMTDFIDFNKDAIPEAVSDSSRPEPHFELENAIKEYSVDELYLKLADSKNRDEMSECITDYLGPQFKKTLFVIIKGQFAIGWTGTSDHEHIANVSQFKVPLNEPSVFSTVVDEKKYYLGPPLNTPGNIIILKTMGDTKPPPLVLVVPIIMKEKVVCAIYLEEGQLSLKDEVLRIQKLAQKISIAFEMLVLRNKLLLT